VVLRGSFHRGDGEWCDADVLRRIKRRTLARLRGEVEPVDRTTLARFLPAWHGLDRPGRGLGRLEEVIVQLEGMPLSYGELERSILPVRVDGFQPRMLDELGAMGFVVWVGCGALGPGDGRVALYRRQSVRKLLDPPQRPDELSPLAGRILELLAAQGACFFTEIEASCAGAGSAHASRDELVEALWDGVWAGLVTNDTFQPLRSLGGKRSARPAKRRGADPRSAGRWSLVAPLIGEGVGATERAHARALMLLERHGLVSREAASLEALPGGFSAVYPVLRAMEDAGKVRRGYFVEGIGGAQFAFPGAVDRLRGLRVPAREPQVTLMSAVDPANPYGWILPSIRPTPTVGSCPGPSSPPTLRANPSATPAPPWCWSTASPPCCSTAARCCSPSPGPRSQRSSGASRRCAIGWHGTAAVRCASIRSMASQPCARPTSVG